MWHYKTLNVKSLPKIYIDANDEFVKKIIDANINDAIPMDMMPLIQRYFLFISHLPLVYINLSSMLVFLEEIDFLETEIASKFNFQKPASLLKRLSPDISFYVSAAENCDMYHPIS